MLRKPAVSGYNGAHDKIVQDGNGGGTVEWQPGDGTRYLLVAKPLDVSEAYLMGAPSGAMIVSVGPGGDSWLTLLLDPAGFHHISYVEEHAYQTKFGAYTLKAITALLNLVIGSEEYGKKLYEEMMANRR